jgi:outer membrane receptor for ferrienterochelin and colicins
MREGKAASMIREPEDLSVVRTTPACLGGDSKGIFHGGVHMDQHKVSRLLASLLILLAFMSSTIQAASDILIVVTPTMGRKNMDSATKKVPTAFTDIVIPGPESTGLIDTGEALRKASSVDLSDYGGATTSPVTLRGSSYRQTLITLDGIPLNPMTGDMVDLSQYMLPDIDRIEIIKGSNSAAFGNSAMGGVINLVTENPSPMDEYDLYSSQGTYGYGLYHGHVSTHAGQVAILANLTHAFADNDFRYEKDDHTWTRRENNDIKNTTGLIKAVFDAQGWQSSVTGNFIDQSKGSPGAEPSYITPDDRTNTIQNSILFETNKAFAQDQTFNARAWILTDRVHNERPSTGDNTTKLTSKNLSASYSKKIGLVTLTPGVEYLDERMSSDDYGGHSRGTSTGSLSACMDFQPVFLEFTGRYDNNTDFDDQWSYHAGAAWTVIDHVQIKTNAGTGYLVPDMGKLYSPSWPGSTFIANPDLKPEHSFSFDIGPCISMNTYGFSVDYFLTNYKDLIKADYPSADTFTYINVNKARSSGIEASAWVAPVSIVKFSTNYILSRNTFESGPFKGNDLGQKPPQVLNLQADYLPEIAGRNATISLSYQFRQGSYEDSANTERTENRYIMNAGAVLDVSKDATISFKVDNLLDDRSPEYVYKSSWGTTWYPVAGRTYRFAAKVSF